VTNNHVIDQAEIIEVDSTKKEPYKARLVGTDKNTDIAVFKELKQRIMPAVSKGSSRQF